MTADEQVNAIAIAKVQATLDSVVQRIDGMDRNQAQLVKLFDDRVASSLNGFNQRFDGLEKRLDMLDRSMEKERDATDRRLNELSGEGESRYERLESRVRAVEKFNAKILGACTLAAALSSVLTALGVKAIGG